MPVSYDRKRFRPVEHSTGGDASNETVFEYRQTGDRVWATYAGGAVEFGMLIARADIFGHLDMRYQHFAADGSVRAGRCRSTPERLPDGRLRLRERWEWTEGGHGTGTSILEEETSDE